MNETLSANIEKRRPGRPKKSEQSLNQTRQLLLRTGLEVLTEKGFSATGLDEILRLAQVPKGSFYHYFKSKEAFGLTLIEEYDQYFTTKLRKHLLDSNVEVRDRLAHFIDDAKQGMDKYGFRRGCLIGNLGQEMGSLPESFRVRLLGVLDGWKAILTEALEQSGFDPERADVLSGFFWIGWEGAVLRAKLQQDGRPLREFQKGFEQLLSIS